MHPKNRIGYGWSFRKFKNRAIEGIKTLEFKIHRTLKKCKEDGLSKNDYVVIGDEEWINNIGNNNENL